MTGGVALWVIKVTTNQERLVRARHQMAAAIYEMRLFLDEPKRIARAQLRLVRASFSYTGRTLPGLFILSIPFGMVFLHLELRHGFAPHTEGSIVLLGVQLFEPAMASKVSVEPASSGLDVELGPVLAEREGRVYYRLRVKAAGRHLVLIHVGEASFDKLVVAYPEGPVSLERVAGLAHAWAASIEPALPSDGPIRRIWVSQPSEDDSWLAMPWWAVWFVGSAVSALLLRRPLGAEL